MTLQICFLIGRMIHLGPVSLVYNGRRGLKAPPAGRALAPAACLLGSPWRPPRTCPPRSWRLPGKGGGRAVSDGKHTALGQNQWVSVLARDVQGTRSKNMFVSNETSIG